MAYRLPDAESEENSMEPAFNDDQTPHSMEPAAGSVEEQLETIQDDVNLLKIEIKQTLVDLREFILNSPIGSLPRDLPRDLPIDNEANPSRGPTPDDQVGSGPANSHGKRSEGGRDPGRTFSPGQDAVHTPTESGGPTGGEYREDAPVRGLSADGDPSPGELVNGQANLIDEITLEEAQKNGGIDVEMLVKLLSWLDSIKGKGLSPQQVGPFLQAYEAKGSISSAMNALILQSVRAIGQTANNGGNSECSSEEYLAYLQELHGIVCGPGNQQVPTSSPRPTGVRRVTASQVEQA